MTFYVPARLFILSFALYVHAMMIRRERNIIKTYRKTDYLFANIPLLRQHINKGFTRGLGMRASGWEGA